MNSNLGCIGIDLDEDDLLALLADLAPSADIVGQTDRDLIHAWQDPSGARLIFSVRNGEPIDVLPGYGGGTGWLLQGCSMLNASVAAAGVFGSDGQQITALTFAPEQHRFLLTRPHPVDVLTRLVGLAFDVEVFADAATFEQSPQSLLSIDGPAAGPRLGAGSLLSYGVWEEPTEADAYARLGGLVRHAEARRNQATGQSFSVARVRVLDLELELCLPAEVVVPTPGQVVAGMVYLVGGLTGIPYGTGPTASAASS